MGDSVNPQITDAINQNNLSVLGLAAAQAMAVNLQVSSHAAGLRTEAQQNAAANMNILRQAVIARAAAGLAP